jgi:hypothetical protein
MAIGDRSPFQVLNKTQGIIQQMGWTGLGKSAIGTLLLSFIFGGIDLFNAMLEVPISILGSFAQVLPAINVAFLGGPADFIGSGLAAAANSFGSGWTGLLSVFQAPLAIGIGLLMLWEIAYYFDAVDSDILGVVWDAPDTLFNSDSSSVADDDDG